MNEKNPATGEIREKVTVTLPPKLVAGVDFLARQQHRSRSNMVEMLLMHGLVAEESGSKRRK